MGRAVSTQRAGLGPLPVVPDRARAGPNYAGRGPAHLPQSNFQDYNTPPFFNY
jgi:hypothetical protein